MILNFMGFSLRCLVPGYGTVHCIQGYALGQPGLEIFDDITTPGGDGNTPYSPRKALPDFSPNVRSSSYGCSSGWGLLGDVI